MLNQFFTSDLALGAAQAAVVAILALMVVLLARRYGIHLERETIVALIRALVQIVIVGSVLVILLQGPDWTGFPVLLAMMVTAASTANRRAKGIPGAFLVSLVSIGLGAGTLIMLLAWAGVIDTALTILVPVGSMMIANAMNTAGLAMDRFRAEVIAHTGHIEAGLSLGAAPDQTIAPYAQAAVQASMIPRIDSLRSLGIVWIPGVMTGMVLSGADPVYAALYQFVVMAMIFATSALTAIFATLFVRVRVFSPAEQLILRPGEQG